LQDDREDLADEDVGPRTGRSALLVVL